MALPPVHGDDACLMFWITAAAGLIFRPRQMRMGIGNAGKSGSIHAVRRDVHVTWPRPNGKRALAIKRRRTVAVAAAGQLRPGGAGPLTLSQKAPILRTDSTNSLNTIGLTT
jgi:hypothetical protein